MRTLLCALLTSFSFPAFAQSSLGITGAELTFGMVEDETGEYRGQGRAALDVAITGFHGFQGDLAYSDTATGGIGTLAAHVYMTPRDGQKYGLFVALSDVDDRALMYASIGAEGMLAIGDDTTIEARAGVGWGDDRLDYIFAGGAIAHQLTPALELELSADVADFDEVGLSTTAYDVALRATYSPKGAPWGVYASIGQSGLTGGDSATRIGLGVRITLGTTGGTDPKTRLFRTPDPVAPLVRRGLW